MIYAIIYIVIMLICIGLLYYFDPFDADETIALSMILGTIWPITFTVGLMIGFLALPILLVNIIFRKG